MLLIFFPVKTDRSAPNLHRWSSYRDNCRKRGSLRVCVPCDVRERVAEIMHTERIRSVGLPFFPNRIPKSSEHHVEHCYSSSFQYCNERESMSLSESEASTGDDSDDGDDGDYEEDQNYAGYDYDEYDDYDFHNDNQVSTLIDSLLAEVPVASSQALLANTSNIQRIRSAMRGVSLTHTMATPPISVYGDFIVSYLTAPPFDQKTHSTAPFYLSDSLIKQPAASNTGSSAKLFVGNIPLSVTSKQLKDFLEERGYPVKDAQLPKSSVCIEMEWYCFIAAAACFKGKPKYAFVRFTSDSVAESVLFASANAPNKFVLMGNPLRFNRQTSKAPQSPNTQATQTLGEKNVSTVSYSISDIYYGTLITGAAMRNIHKRPSSIVSSHDEFGVIGHSFSGTGINVPFTVTLDPKKRKIALVGETTSNTAGVMDVTDRLSFEWRFSE